MAMKKSSAKVASSKTVQSVTEVLDNLVASLPPKTPVTKGRNNKWRIDLSEEGKDTFKRWIEAKVVSEPVMARLENAKDMLNDLCLEAFVQKFFEARNRPSNPQLALTDGSADDCTANWMFTDKFKVRLPEVPEGADAKEIFAQAFVDVAGLHPSEAQKLVDTELLLNPVIGVRPINDLLSGHFSNGREFVPATDVEKSAGRKLAAFLSARDALNVEPLTDEEKIAMIQRDNGVTVRAGFLDRVANYVQTPEQLLGIFKLLIPVVYPANPKFAINDNPVRQGERKIAAAADILGTAAE